MIDRYERNQQKEEPLHDAPDPNTSRSKESFTENFHAILLVPHPSNLVER
jgi:hypothetical protein